MTASGHANSDSAGQQINPEVAVDPDGTPVSGAVAFTVVWEDIQGTNPSTVKAAGFTGPATRAYPSDVTVSQTTGQHHHPAVAVSAAGDAWVVWDQDADADGGYDIGLVRVSKTGTVGTRGLATSNTASQQTHASIAATFNGEFAVTWRSDQTIRMRSFKAGGAPRHNDVDVATGGVTPRVGLDEQGGAVVAWTVAAADLDVWVRGFNPDGTTTGRLAAQPLMQTSAGRQEGIAIAVSPYGEVSAAYTDDSNGNDFDQVKLGLGVLNTGW